MTGNMTRDDAEKMLGCIIGQPLQYGRIYQEYGMYGLGFGPLFKVPSWNGVPKLVCPYTFHIQCQLKIIDREKCSAIKFMADTPPEIFTTNIMQLVCLVVKRFALSDKFDLWIDLGDYWIVFVTWEDETESWRFFTPESDDPHLVVSSSWLCLDY